MLKKIKQDRNFLLTVIAVTILLGMLEFFCWKIFSAGFFVKAIIFLIAALIFYVQQVLPVQIYKRKAQWNLSLTYFLFCLLIEIPLMIFPLKGLVFIFKIVSSLLFLGFVNAASMEINLWAGIENLLKNKCVKAIVSVIVLLLAFQLNKVCFSGFQSNSILGLIPQAGFSVIYILAIYILMPLFKKDK